MVKKNLVCGVSIFLLAAAACADKSGNPASPSAAASAGLSAASDGSTLKATAPTPQSPVGGGRLANSFSPTLVVSNSQRMHADFVPSYRFQVLDGSAVVDESVVGEGSGTTSYAVPIRLAVNKAYTWRARSEYQGSAGPWSASAAFLTPDEPEGYIKLGEVYDPLANSKTVGSIHGPVTFIPGVGIQLQDFSSYIEYRMPQTMTEGEFSLLVQGLGGGTEGGKTKVMSMSDGDADITTNDYRATFEKRGASTTVAWRFRFGGGRQVDTEGAERVSVGFRNANTYLWRVTWSTAGVNLQIYEFVNGAIGNKIYDAGKPTGGTYRPADHRIYLGSPQGRGGIVDATVPGIIIRQVWVSTSPRPDFANK